MEQQHRRNVTLNSGGDHWPVASPWLV